IARVASGLQQTKAAKAIARAILIQIGPTEVLNTQTRLQTRRARKSASIRMNWAKGVITARSADAPIQIARQPDRSGTKLAQPAALARQSRRPALRPCSKSSPRLLQTAKRCHGERSSSR